MFKLLSPKKINALPRTPGIYALRSARKILYIGKAANIRERTRNHFQQPSFRDELFISDIKKIGYIKTASEIEALLLEARLIRKYQPKFNVEWRDDKNYFYVGITKETYPRVFIGHQPQQILNFQFSIFNFQTNPKFKTLSSKLSTTNHQLQTTHIGPFVDGRAIKQTLKVLRRVFPYRSCRTLPKRPCLYYQLKRCPGPCIGTGEKENRENMQNLIKVLRGKKTPVLRALKREMRFCAQKQDFEKAGVKRDQITALENVFQHRHILQRTEGTSPRNQVPWELFPRNLVPWTGSFGSLWQKTEKAIKQLVNVKSPIKRIEGYDISNIQGKEATGAMVVFEKGEPKKQDYRKFKITGEFTPHRPERKRGTGAGPNDVAMVKEVLRRRLTHDEWPLPQLILIDGGKGQLNAARQCLTSAVKHIQVMALAKRKNELYLVDRKRPILLKNLPQEVANLILHLRDEAHRFAVKYHRKLRKKTLFL